MPRKFWLFLSPLISLALLLALLTLLSPSPLWVRAAPQPPDNDPVRAALDYLQAQQQADGGILGFSGSSDPDTTARTVLALLATGQPIGDFVSSEGLTMIDYLAAQAISYTHDVTGTLFPARAGLLLAAAASGGGDPSAFGGMDLVDELEATFQVNTGVYSSTATQDWSSGAASDLSQAWAILGLSLAGRSVPISATIYLSTTQTADGSWGFGDPDTTALAVTSLLASQQFTADSAIIQNALEYFRTMQLPSGGWRPSWDTDPLNADSTGWIIQALISAGQSPLEMWKAADGDPVSALRGLLKPDGSIGGAYANPYSTADALIGLGGNTLAVSGSGTSLPPKETIQRAGLVVQYGDGTVYTACVPFAEETISGFELLQRSGLALETATDPNLGSAVCKINEVGCEANSCFCKMPEYWSYWQFADGQWAYAVSGADRSQVGDGQVEGWSWGEGTAPPIFTFEQVCEFSPGGAADTQAQPTQPTESITAYPEPAATISTASSAYPAPATPLPPTTYPAVPTESRASPVVDTPQSQTTSYIIFGLLVVALAAGLVLMLRARRKKPQL